MPSVMPLENAMNSRACFKARLTRASGSVCRSPEAAAPGDPAELCGYAVQVYHNFFEAAW
jgi:hypothetical protein